MLIVLRLGKVLQSRRLRYDHDIADPSMLFLLLASSSSPFVFRATGENRMVVPGDDDESISVWHMGSRIAGNNAIDPSTMFAGLDKPNEDMPIHDHCDDAASKVKGL